MLTNDEYYKKVKLPQVMTIKCDVCSKVCALYWTCNMRYERINKQNREDRLKIIFLSDGVYHFCDNECMKKWINDNWQKIEAEFKKEIPEDKYANDLFKETHVDEMEDDVNIQDIEDDII